MREWIEETRRVLGPPPRRFGLVRWFYNRIAPPRFVYEIPTYDRLLEIYRRRGDLLARGDVVWGAIVQANNLLWEPGSHDAPGVILYSPDRTFDGEADELEHIARSLFSLKGTKPKDPELATFAAVITNEFTVLMREPVPRALTGGREVKRRAYGPSGVGSAHDHGGDGLSLLCHANYVRSPSGSVTGDRQRA